jgi:Flp pilus assembly protein TadB
VDKKMETTNQYFNTKQSIRHGFKRIMSSPWQVPFCVLVTAYGIYRFGWGDWRVIAMYIITGVLILGLVWGRVKKKKRQ